MSGVVYLSPRDIDAHRLRLPAEIYDLLDALSLIVAQDPICAGDYLQGVRGQLWNVNGFLKVYDKAAKAYPALVTPRHGDPSSEA